MVGKHSKGMPVDPVWTVNGQRATGNGQWSSGLTSTTRAPPLIRPEWVQVVHVHTYGSAQRPSQGMGACTS